MTDQQYAPPPPPPEYNYGPPPQKKGLGIAAMVLGIVAIVLSFIPLIGMLSFILGPLAVVLGIIAFVKRWGRGQAITGIITGALGTVIVFIGFMLFGAIVTDFDEAMSEAEEQLDDDSETESREDLEAEAEEAAEEADEDATEADEIQEEAAPEEEEAAADEAAEWTEVVSVSGTGDQRTEVFTIEGDARITYEFNASGEDAEWAMATVYLVAEGDSLAEDGGLPEVMIDGADSGENLLYQTGDYYLDISALDYDDWTVTIEEQQ